MAWCFTFTVTFHTRKMASVDKLRGNNQKAFSGIMIKSKFVKYRKYMIQLKLIDVGTATIFGNE
jgi:hypothetical protein